MASPDGKYSMHIRTVQGSSLKGLFEVLKELLNDVNVVVNASGIKVLAMDSAQVTLCHCLLEAQNFEVFHCPETVVIGLNVQNLYKLLKTVSSQDTLTLQIEEDCPNDLEIIIQNSEKKSKTFYRLRLLDIDDDHVKVPTVEMTTCITMASVDFQRLIRDMLTVGTVLRVRVKKREVIFETSGDFASQRTILETSEALNETEDEIDLSFSLKLLSLFSKASTLSTTCSLWLPGRLPARSAVRRGKPRTHPYDHWPQRPSDDPPHGARTVSSSALINPLMASLAVAHVPNTLPAHGMPIVQCSGASRNMAENPSYGGARSPRAPYITTSGPRPTSTHIVCPGAAKSAPRRCGAPAYRHVCCRPLPQRGKRILQDVPCIIVRRTIDEREHGIHVRIDGLPHAHDPPFDERPCGPWPPPGGPPRCGRPPRAMGSRRRTPARA